LRLYNKVHELRIQRDGLHVVEGYSKALCKLLRKPLDIEKLRQYLEYNVETMIRFE